MFEELELFLKNTVSVELFKVIKDALECFDRINLQNYQDDYVQLIMLADTKDLNTTVDLILNNILQKQHMLLKEHDIELIDDISIESNTLFINGILDIQEYSDKNALLATASLELDTNEIFAELLALVTTLSVEEILPNIKSVSVTIIKAIIDITKYLYEAEMAVKQKYITAIKQFSIYINSDNLKIINLLKEDLHIGLDFLVYANIIGRDFETMSVDDISKELICMALLSPDGYDNPAAIINSNLDKFISDINKITAVSMRTQELILTFKK